MSDINDKDKPNEQQKEMKPSEIILRWGHVGTSQKLNSVPKNIHLPNSKLELIRSKNICWSINLWLVPYNLPQKKEDQYSLKKWCHWNGTPIFSLRLGTPIFDSALRWLKQLLLQPRLPHTKEAIDPRFACFYQHWAEVRNLEDNGITPLYIYT